MFSKNAHSIQPPQLTDIDTTTLLLAIQNNTVDLSIEIVDSENKQDSLFTYFEEQNTRRYVITPSDTPVLAAMCDDLVEYIKDSPTRHRTSNEGYFVDIYMDPIKTATTNTESDDNDSFEKRGFNNPSKYYTHALENETDGALEHNTNTTQNRIPEDDQITLTNNFATQEIATFIVACDLYRKIRNDTTTVDGLLDASEVQTEPKQYLTGMSHGARLRYLLEAAIEPYPTNHFADAMYTPVPEADLGLELLAAAGICTRNVEGNTTQNRTDTELSDCEYAFSNEYREWISNQSERDIHTEAGRYLTMKHSDDIITPVYKALRSQTFTLRNHLLEELYTEY